MTRLTQGPEELARFAVASEPGNERLALARVAEALVGAGLSDDQLERLKTAVAEATMNGIEHGNANRPELPVEVAVLRSPAEVVVTVTDLGGEKRRSHAEEEAEVPDLAAKLAGLQRPRGWGLFLIEHMVDEVDDSTDGDRHTVRLVMRHTPDLGTEGDLGRDRSLGKEGSR
jgi:anti-sigma regulatory factor (Ser/Thr protein kinase)